MILDEFDPAEGLITPWATDSETSEPVAETLIMPFSQAVVSAVSRAATTRRIGTLHSLSGDVSIYWHAGVTVVPAGLGAPVVISRLEKMMALGVKRVILFGTCGVLDQSLKTHQVIVPTAAVRDEGTSYHYAPASSEIAMAPTRVAELLTALEVEGIDAVTAKTWSTDAFFRETAAKTARRKAAGCRVVDMEAAAIAAWGAYRRVATYQFFTAADHLDAAAGQWHERRAERAVPGADFFALALALANRLK